MRERGQASVLLVGVVLLGLAFAGLAVDGTRLFTARRDLHNIADSAALAGASAIDEAAVPRHRRRRGAARRGRGPSRRRVGAAGVGPPGRHPGRHPGRRHPHRGARSPDPSTSRSSACSVPTTQTIGAHATASPDTG